MKYTNTTWIRINDMLSLLIRPALLGVDRLPHGDVSDWRAVAIAFDEMDEELIAQRDWLKVRSDWKVGAVVFQLMSRPLGPMGLANYDVLRQTVGEACPVPDRLVYKTEKVQ